MSKTFLNLIAHRMNIGDYLIPQNNQVDNSKEALEALTSILRFAPDLQNINGFECDFRLTKDNELVVIHEGNIKTITAEKIERDIKDLTYEELQKIYISDIAYYYHGLKARALLLPDAKKLREIIDYKLNSRTIVPKAHELFEYLAIIGYKGEILVELKEKTDECRDATIELINLYKDKLNIAVQSYDAKRTIYIGEKTGVKIGVLEDILKLNQKQNITPEFIKNMPFDFYSLIWPKVNDKRLESMVAYDKELYTWTIDSAAHLWAVLNSLEYFYDKYGAIPENTHLITNIPLVLNTYLNNQSVKVPYVRSIKEKYQKLFGTEEKNIFKL